MNNNSSNPGKGNHCLSRSMGVWILLVSLLVNCFLLGLLIAPVVRPPMPPPFMGPPGEMIEHLTSGLSPSDAAIVRDAFQKNEPVFDENRQNMDAAMHGMLAVLRQPKLDPEELKKALQNMSAVRSKLDEAMANSIMETARRLSPEGRRHIANTLPPPGMHMPPPGLPMHPPQPWDNKDGAGPVPSFDGAPPPPPSD